MQMDGATIVPKATSTWADYYWEIVAVGDFAGGGKAQPAAVASLGDRAGLADDGHAFGGTFGHTGR